jgi:hypothetical protein
VSDFLNWLGGLSPVSTVLVAVATIVSAVATAIAAIAASRSAKASERNLAEAERARVQTAEPFLSVSIPNPFFTISWRPETDEVPRLVEGWTTATYGVGSFSPIVLMFSNYGGGPALDLKITVETLQSDVPTPDTVIAETGAAAGRELRWSDGLLRARGGQVRVDNVRRDYAPACASDAPQTMDLTAELLLRLLPLTMSMEDVYHPRGTPAGEGRVSWKVSVKYRTALSDEEREIKREFYAERVRIDTLPVGAGTQWFEKYYRCELKMKPADGFEVTPHPVEAHAS